MPKLRLFFSLPFYFFFTLPLNIFIQYIYIQIHIYYYYYYHNHHRLRFSPLIWLSHLVISLVSSFSFSSFSLLHLLVLVNHLSYPTANQLPAHTFYPTHRQIKPPSTHILYFHFFFLISFYLFVFSLKTFFFPIFQAVYHSNHAAPCHGLGN